MSEEKAAPVKEAKAEKIVQNGITRPKVGTKTGRVFEIADAISEEAGAPAKRKAVIDTALAEDINAATAATQYGRWRKFNGLKGTDTPADAPVEAPVEETLEDAPEA
jgi:hypothetical protein